MKDQSKDTSRNMDNYVRDYKALPYESIQEEFRVIELVKALDEFLWQSIVEVGCGNNSITTYLKNFKRAMIIEPVKELLEKNLLKAESDERLSGFHGYLTNFKQSSNEKFDVCVLSSLLHEIPNQSEMLIDCWNLLNPGGKLVVNVPNAMSLHRILALNKGLIGSVFEISQTQKRMQQLSPPFSTESLEHLIRSNGFSIQRIYTVIPKPFDHQSMSDFLTLGIFSEGFLEQLNMMSEVFEPFGSEIMAICIKVAS
jgi:trans-aconitate methyltransferase